MRHKEESARRAEKKLAEGEARFETAEARATAAERQLAEAKSQVQTLTTELSSQKKLVKQAEGEVEWLRSELEDQKKLYTDAMNEVSHLRGDLKSLTAKVDELEASNSARTAQIATLEQEKQTMKAEMTKLTERFNDSLHAANGAKKEIEDQKSAVDIKFVATTESTAVAAQEQVEETKAEEQEPIPVTISRAEYRAERKTSSLQRWLASLMVILTLIAILQPVLTAPAVKTFFQNHALSKNFFQQEQNPSIAENESSWTQPEATPEITPLPDDYHGSDNAEHIDINSGNTTNPTQPAPVETASGLTSIDKILNWITENLYKVAGLVTVCFSGGAAYYSYKHSARFQ
jgi:predicted  nucleic acid-binding Zn-ribbon protein